MRTILNLMDLSLLLTLSVSGCVRIVKHPDAPMLIQQGRGRLQIAVYSAECDCLVDYGWVDAKDLAGLTVGKYDWK